MTTRQRLRGGHGWLLAGVLGSSLLLPTAQARAHTAFPGMGEFASGFLHSLTTPPHLLVLLALGLFVGQHAPLRIKAPATIFAAAAAVGLLLTAVSPIGGVFPPILIATGLGVGACVAVGVPLHFRVRLGACAIAALLLGMDSGVEPGTPGMAAAKILFATWASLTLCLVNAAFYVSLLPPVRWVQIGVRVLGSWIVAVAFLLLAFALRR